MPVDFESINVNNLLVVGASDAAIGSPVGFSVTSSRGVQIGQNCLDWNATTAAYAGRRFPMPGGGIDLSSGVFAINIGHNSFSRVQCPNFSGNCLTIRLYSGTANYANFKVYAPDTIGILGDYLPYVIAGNAAPDSTVGTFDATNVTHFAVMQGWVSLGGSSSSYIIYVSRACYIKSVAGDSSIPKIYGTAEIEDLVDDAFGNGGDTLKHYMFSFQNSAAFIPAAIQLGKSGEVSNVTMRNDTLTIPSKSINDPRFHTERNALIWRQQWQAGDTLDLQNKTFQMGLPVNLDCFDSNVGASLNLNGFSLNGSVGTIAIGADCTGAITVNALATNEKIIARDTVSVDNWDITGDLEVESLADISDLTATRLILTQAGTYNFTDCTIGETVNNSAGNILINALGNSVISQKSGNPISVLYEVTISHNAVGGSFAYQNTSKYLNLVGVYASHTLAQTANPSPSAADYYRLSDNSEHAYFDGTAWVELSGVAIHEGFIAAATLGGSGISQDHTINIEEGSSIRAAIDTFGKKMNVENFTVTGPTTVNLLLSENNNVNSASIPDALLILPQLELTSPDENGLTQMKTPDLSNTDVEVAGAVVELARMTEGSLSGALATNNAELAEITNIGELTLKNDTLQIIPLDSAAAGDQIKVPLKLNLVNYTIEATPTTPSNTFVCFDSVSKTIVNGATLINGDTASGDTAEVIYDYFIDSNREDVFKADVSTIASNIDSIKIKTDQMNFTGSDIQSVASNMVSNPLLANDARLDNLDAAISNTATASVLSAVQLIVNDILSDTNELQQNQGSGGGDTADVIYNYFTDSNREDLFKADISSLLSNLLIVKTKTDQMNFTGTDIQSISSNANTLTPDNTSIAAIKTITDRLAFLIENVNGERFTEKALEEVNLQSILDALQLIATKANQNIINEGVKTSSRFRTHAQDLQDL